MGIFKYSLILNICNTLRWILFNKNKVIFVLCRIADALFKADNDYLTFPPNATRKKLVQQPGVQPEDAGMQPVVEPCKFSGQPEVDPEDAGVQPVVDPDYSCVQPVVEPDDSGVQSMVEPDDSSVQPVVEPGNSVVQPW